MNENSKEYVMQTAREHGVKFIRLWFTDMLGFLKSFAITVEELEDALEVGKSFDGFSIEGFSRVDESDMVAMPDPETFSILPENLLDALRKMESSRLVRNCLGEDLFEKLIQNKKIEWQRYHCHISGYEMKRYLPLL